MRKEKNVIVLVEVFKENLGDTPVKDILIPDPGNGVDRI
jgi:hypothetical protein